MVQVFVAYDDLKNQQGEQVVATRTETLSFAGRSVDLDLTDETVEQVLIMLQDLFKIGRVNHRAQPRKTFVKGQETATAAYNRGMREYAKLIGKTVTRTSSGSYYYSDEIRRLYANHLKQQSALGS